MLVRSSSPYLGPRRKGPLPHTRRPEHSVSGTPLVRSDHGLPTGGQASLACGGLRACSAPWSRETCLSLVPNSVNLCTCAGRALNLPVCQWVLYFALQALCPSAKHTDFPQKEGPIFLSPSVCPGVASAPRSCLVSIYRFSLVCTKASMATRQGMPVTACLTHS